MNDSASFYSQDLAFIHYSGFQQLIREASPFLLDLFLQQNLKGGVVVDLGCGSGYWLKQLVHAGYRPVGIELSQSFIDMARSVAPEATLIQGSAFDFTLPGSQAVTAIGEVLCYRQDSEKISLKTFFQHVFQALYINGVLAFDLLIQDPTTPLDYRSWQSGDNWAVLVEVQEDCANQWVTRDIQTFRADRGHLYNRAREFHRLQTYSSETVLEELHDCGFKAYTAKGYGHYSLPFRRQAFVAIKPG